MGGQSTVSKTSNARRVMYRAYAASATGTALEWYDFAIYSVAAALVFPEVFFPNSDPTAGTLLAFSTYAVGYISRPVGGFVFGRLGDVIGRKHLLVVTLIIIGATTFLIGLLPGYATLGIAAPIALVVLRFAQGVAVGGEWGGAVLLSSEYGNPKRRGLLASAAQVGTPIGNLMANGVLALLAVVLTDEQFTSWGWRVAFLLSAVLVGFGLWIRMKLEDTPVFQALSESGERPEAPVAEVFGTERRALVAGILTRICPDITFALFSVFSITYGVQKLGFSRSEVLVAVMVGSAAQIVFTPAAGALSDRVNRRLMFGVATGGAFVWSIAFFVIVQDGSLLLMIVGVVGGLAFHSLMYGPQAAFISEQFSVRLRATGSSLVFSLSGIVGGALAPLIFTYLFTRTGSWDLIPVYIGIAAACTITGLAIGRNPDREEESHYSPLEREPEGFAGRVEAFE
ncbi:MFS transporter [Rhodococcus sp. ACPA1]|uniref:MFS transporter n=1 Tax=Rhodococcus sp. ACPA1 TaxID=2028572 RepID=UPI000BB0D690|nr:MFS transporter [Rhodococcus sp. ACPA1]PBC51781.1 MFS transporter [Rhodococcus sp. ACPA1]